MSVKLPRLYSDGYKFVRLVNPISLSLTQNITPLDTASITLPLGEELPARSYVELFTPYGSAGMFRVRSPHDAYGQETTTAELEHAISEVGDYVIKEEISKMMAADAAMKKAFSHYNGNKWKLGSVSALGTGKIAFEAKYDRVLDAMLSILEQKRDCRMAFDFTTNPWTVKVVKKGTEVSAEGRLARNVTSATISYDDSELCTRVYYQTFDKNKKATWKSKDADTKSDYGIVEGTVRTSSDMTDAEITATVNAYLKDHSKPRISISIQADELSQVTGESMDKFTIGKLMRLNLIDYGIIVEETITSINWADVYGSRSVTVNLGDEEDTVVTFLHNLDSKGSGGGGGGRAKDKKEQEWSEYIVQWETLDDSVAGMVAKQDRYGNILEQAGLTLNSKGLLVYAKTKNGLYHQFDVLNDSFTSGINDAKKELNSTIKQTADKVDIIVEGTGKNAKIKPAAIQASIDTATGKSKIRLSASHIILDGEAVASSIEATDIMVANFNAANGEFTGDLSVLGSTGINCASDIKGQCGDFVSLKVEDSGGTSRTASWKSFTYRHCGLGTSETYKDSSGTNHVGRLVTSYTDTTVYYLGR